MHALEPGQYVIQVDVGSKPLIGTKPNVPVTPVVADGPDRIFTVRKLEDGNYTLALGPRFTREDHGNVVASLDRRPPGIWSIQSVGDRLYTIKVPNTDYGWTLYDTHPDAYVAVGWFETPQPGQKWHFIPVLRD